ncbi:hypothetical protein AMAG_16487 [Allomyces macrogynus ATCC 38327]|uniref:Protein BFR2 n=1 Tax=Allomyces macrogynus (strain ATCC 38327) TaxID=578462 RepID=A0A0L0TCH1_ALLM3|nr:hypothetical protein AMAG_16487 [Allomyces macrogynus ATCC 38327]|eukprot:KNE72442.1 hypothetical protein AMAG_16487 [Allomyces macrogynus ATCC 38327]
MPSKPSAPKKPGSSLAAALSFLDSTKPVDLDPESAAFRGSDDDNDSDDERDRSHYAAVGKSALRAAVAAPIDEHGKYAGRSVSRKAVFSDASDDVDDEDDGEDDEEESDENDEGDASDTEDLVFRAPSGKSSSGLDWGDAAGLDGDMSDYEPAEAFGRSDDDSSDEDEDDAASGSDGDEDVETTPREENLTRKALDTADAAGTDAEKGAHIKAQMELWDALLDLRIRLQKVIAIANRFPDPDEFSDFAAGNEDVLEAAQATLLDVAGSVTTAQQVLVDQNPLVQRALGEDVPKLGKRKTMDETWAAVTQFQDGFQAFRADALEKWHEKVSATAGVPLTKKFKAINTSLAHQLESVLSDRDRLVKRTQIKRAEYRILTLRSPTDSSSTPTTTTAATTGGKERDLEAAAEAAAASKTIRIDPVPSIFDDTDWYSVLLKEVIDRKLALNPSAAAAHVATMRAASRTKRAVDTRASKGRKLRFAPHEKLQHFMAPMPVAPYYKPAPGAGSAAVGGMGGSERSLVATGNLAPQIWHEEMIEELFSSLFGVKEERVRKEDVERKKREAERLAKQQAKVGKLRLFG